ncbi:MAG: metallophosphoesterase [Kiritimatiellia bacterium]
MIPPPARLDAPRPRRPREAGTVPLLLIPALLLLPAESWALGSLVDHLFRGIHRLFVVNGIVLPALLALWAAGFGLTRRISPNGAAGALLAAALIGGTAWYATRVEPRRLKVREVELRTEKLDRPLRILHISDVQTARVTAYEEGVFRKMAELNPDIILHTGDLVQAHGRSRDGEERAKLLGLFGTLRPPLGIWHVHGDVDRHLVRLDAEALAPLQVLAGESADLSTPGGNVSLYGLTLDGSRNAWDPNPDVRRWAEGTAGFKILLGHDPNYVLQARDLPVDLCLAGHTHGGQIRLPFLGPPLTLCNVPRRLARGFHRLGETWLNVSAGIGGEHSGGLPTLRLNCPPEMTLIRVLPAAGG